MLGGAVMSARTQAFVLVLFGGALLRLATTDALLRYVRPVARPWVLLAGAAVVALALWSLAVGSGRPDAEHEADEHQTDEHQTDEHQTDEHQTDEHQAEQREADGHRHRGASRAAWLVLAPVVAILVVAPPALGAYSAKRLPVSAIKVPSRHVPALTGTDLVRMSLLDYYSRAAFDDGRTLVGRRVALTGFVLRVEPGGFQLARLMIEIGGRDGACPARRHRDADSPAREPLRLSCVGQGPSPSVKPVGVARDRRRAPRGDALC